MANQNNISSENDRRQISLNNQTLWNELSSAQKVAASSLFNYGFELKFIRVCPTEKVVGLLLDGKPATINDEGDINTNPGIDIRE
ncbi:hypothetical protein RI845_07400 [Thalassotalea nanhaiensis]|uniref:Uncharacterized protein n=1 Tax=Thalassotalea nanhaiensis TaxID=3065648 RepID=A0ABY9TM87_9GAMM|nr:hypothetical protein RI845_07400 [Colwelliaceae bacterium SQ345]